MSRPDRLVLVTGTATEVGKTWVAADVLRALLARGLGVAARKPVQSFEAGAGATDAELLADATGEPVDTVCPTHRRYEVAMAPPMAADALGHPPFTIADLASEITWPPSVDVGLVESAGGPRSPLACDGDTVDLVRVLRPDAVVLVADAGLGTINAVRLCAAALEPAVPLHVLLNRFDDADDLHRRNRDWLVAAGLDVVTTTDALVARILGDATAALPERLTRRVDG